MKGHKDVRRSCQDSYTKSADDIAAKLPSPFWLETLCYKHRITGVSGVDRRSPQRDKFSKKHCTFEAQRHAARDTELHNTFAFI